MAGYNCAIPVRLAPAAIAFLVAAPLISGCAGASGDRTRPSQFRHDFIAFAACMRSHGLSAYPDPRFSIGPDGLQVRISPGALNPDSPAFRSADGACHERLPNGGSPTPTTSGGTPARAQKLRFASCMRSHDIPSFPDPEHDGAFDLPTQVDPQAPAFASALKACAGLRPTSLLLSHSSG